MKQKMKILSMLFIPNYPIRFCQCFIILNVPKNWNEMNAPDNINSISPATVIKSLFFAHYNPYNSHRKTA